MKPHERKQKSHDGGRFVPVGLISHYTIYGLVHIPSRFSAICLIGSLHLDSSGTRWLITIVKDRDIETTAS